MQIPAFLKDRHFLPWLTVILFSAPPLARLAGVSLFVKENSGLGRLYAHPRIAVGVVVLLGSVFGLARLWVAHPKRVRILAYVLWGVGCLLFWFFDAATGLEVSLTGLLLGPQQTST